MTLRTAAAAVLARWDSPQWEWTQHGPTADLMHTLRAALAQPAAPDVQPVAWIDKHGNIDRGLDAILSPDGWIPLYAAAQAAQPAPQPLTEAAPTPTGLASHKAPLLSDNAKPPADDWQHLKRYGYAPGNYMGKCRSCNEIVHSIDKRAICCRPCAEKRHASQPPAPSVQPPVRERLTETQIDSASPLRIESAHWFKLGARWAERALIGGEG